MQKRGAKVRRRGMVVPSERQLGVVEDVVDQVQA